MCTTRDGTFKEKLFSFKPLIDIAAAAVGVACYAYLPQQIVAGGAQIVDAQMAVQHLGQQYPAARGFLNEAIAQGRGNNDFHNILNNQRGVNGAIEMLDHFQQGLAAGNNNVVNHGRSMIGTALCIGASGVIEIAKGMFSKKSITECYTKQICPETSICDTAKHEPCTPGEYTCDLIGQASDQTEL